MKFTAVNNLIAQLHAISDSNYNKDQPLHFATGYFVFLHEAVVHGRRYCEKFSDVK